MRQLGRCIGLAELKGHKAGPLAGLELLLRPRLSVQRVSQKHWDFVLGLEAGPQQQKAAAG